MWHSPRRSPPLFHASHRSAADIAFPEGRAITVRGARVHSDLSKFSQTDYNIPLAEMGWRREATFHGGTPRHAKYDSVYLRASDSRQTSNMMDAGGRVRCLRRIRRGLVGGGGEPSALISPVR